MLGARLCARTFSGFAPLADYADAARSISNSRNCSTSHFSIQLVFRSRGYKSTLVSCKSYRGRFGDRSTNADDRDHDHNYLLAFVLVSETMRHYRMRRQGFEEEMKWQSSSELLPFSVRAKESRVDVNSLGLGFLRRFQSPTIFLKISCDGDFLLPIIVGELAVEKLIDTLGEDEYGNWDCPNQFQLVRDLVGKLGYEPGEKDILSLDARPSDAINVATRCKAPIYVNKQIVSTDAIRIVYGLGSAHGRKAIYDVSLDSATDDPDLLAEELDLVRNMNLSVEEERYHDAAMWRERLNKLRKSRDEQ
ncbi:bifunctional nuclease 2 isoform X2 [Malania oleifera]|uniref:bifunctional nuclease 2 isoform X2 n=1 Tax=Malania oleifera TaxID=397392 RepID=UPI0025AE3830|nr:bifunctional nuclease 2 isoform X2 [Malania oleifera]